MSQERSKPFGDIYYDSWNGNPFFRKIGSKWSPSSQTIRQIGDERRHRSVFREPHFYGPDQSSNQVKIVG